MPWGEEIMNKAFLLTGGNMDDRRAELARAVRLIAAACGKINAVSSFYETAAWGKTDQPPFLNQAIELHTAFDAQKLLHELLAIEKRLGRVRKEKNGPRLIDIDILLFNDDVIDQPNLKVPHPELANRRFALTPLAEIAKELKHPVLQKTIATLLRDCPDTLAVKKI
jgi:2-amino-4-hydroxy-6-hydroxymethyldihydropteridine diphosphokinase